MVVFPSLMQLQNLVSIKMAPIQADLEILRGHVKLAAPYLPYFFGYKTEFFPSKTIPKI